MSMQQKGSPFVLLAAWWHGLSANSSVWIAHWPTSIVWLISPSFSRRVDVFIQSAICYLMFEWLAWHVAEGYLRAQWAEEEKVGRYL